MTSALMAALGCFILAGAHYIRDGETFTYHVYQWAPLFFLLMHEVAYRATKSRGASLKREWWDQR